MAAADGGGTELMAPPKVKGKTLTFAPVVNVGSSASIDSARRSRDGEHGGEDGRNTLKTMSAKQKKRAEHVEDEYIRRVSLYETFRFADGGGAQGGPTGSQATFLQNGKSAMQFTHWYPTSQKFSFFYTISFWIAILSLQASFLMCFAHFVDYGEYLHLFRNHYPHQCHAWVDVMVSMLFLMATYFAWLQVVNIQKSEVSRRAWPEDWNDVLPHVAIESVVGALAYFGAMILWSVSALTGVLPQNYKVGIATLLFGWSGWDVLIALKAMFAVTDWIAGIGFFVGGICECLHNRHAESVYQPVVWLAIFNTIGGLNIFLSSTCVLTNNKDTQFRMVNHVMAGVSYATSSIFQLAMWKANDYGLSLLSQLNSYLDNIEAKEDDALDHLESSAPGTSYARISGLVRKLRDRMKRDSTTRSTYERKEELTMRSLTFLCLYCYLFIVTYLNCISTVYTAGSNLRHFMDVCMDLLWLMIVLLVLVVHSTITKTPNQEPYRSAVFFERFILTSASLVQTRIFVASFPDPGVYY